MIYSRFGTDPGMLKFESKINQVQVKTNYDSMILNSNDSFILKVIFKKLNNNANDIYSETLEFGNEWPSHLQNQLIESREKSGLD